MIEQLFKLSVTDDKAVEKVIMDENVHYVHMVFNNGEGMPEHYSNSNVYMTVLRGTLFLALDAQDDHLYKKGDLLKIPVNIKMNVRNKHPEVLELIVVKAPAPGATQNKKA